MEDVDPSGGREPAPLESLQPLLAERGQHARALDADDLFEETGEEDRVPCLVDQLGREKNAGRFVGGRVNER